MTERVKRCKAVRKLRRTDESLGLQIFETQYPRVRSLVTIPTVLCGFRSTYIRNVM